MLANFEKLEKPKELFTDKNIKHRLFKCLDNSVKKIVKDCKEIPIAFSGGLDSSILTYLASKYSKLILFCVGFEDSYDVKNAKRVVDILNNLSRRRRHYIMSPAGELELNIIPPHRSLSLEDSSELSAFSPQFEARLWRGNRDVLSLNFLSDKLELNIIYLDKINLKEYLRKTIEIMGTDNKLAIDLNLPYFVLLEELKKRRYENFISGQGADELFAGYNRYKKSENLEDDLWRDIKEIYQTNQRHNLKIENHFGIKALFPFLEEEFVNLALKISPDLKIKNGVNKYILREAFQEYLPEEIIIQNKKAFQYGSGAHRVLEKLLKNS